MASGNSKVNFQRHLMRKGLQVLVPQLPFILDGPDFFVWNGVRSLILFFPRASERSAPSLFAGRLAGSVLAFPSYVQPAVGILGREDEALARNMGGAVPVLLSPDEVVRFAETSTNRSSSDTYQLRKIKQLHMRRFSRIAAISVERGRGEIKASPVGEHFKVSTGLQRRNAGERAVHGLRAVETEDGLVLSTTSKRSSRRAAAEATHANYSSLYKLDNGVPYPTNDTVDKGVWAEELISAGREYALWFALVHASPGVRI